MWWTGRGGWKRGTRWGRVVGLGCGRRVMWCMCAQANNPGGGPIYYDLLSVVVRCLLHVVVALCR